MSNVVVWETGQAWSAVYSQIQSIGTDKPIICLVAYDTEANRLVTAQGGGCVTHLSNVYFMALSPINASDSETKMRVGVEAGFVLGVDTARDAAVFQSRNIMWVPHAETTRWVAGENLILSLDGGGISIEQCNGSAVFEIEQFQITLTNRAELAYGGGLCIDVASGGFGSVIMADASVVFPGCFADGSNVRVIIDASSQAAGAATTPGSPPLEILVQDRAEQVEYDDNREPSRTLGATTVQGAIDAIKLLLP